MGEDIHWEVEKLDAVFPATGFVTQCTWTVFSNKSLRNDGNAG